MSAVYRAPIFFATSFRAGWKAAAGAMMAETAFRVITSGFYGAFTQALRRMEPAWLAIALVLVIAPAFVQGLELLVHALRHTPNLMRGVLASSTLTAIASLFNWFAMRKGTLVTGQEGQSFVQDLKQLPVVIFQFLAALPLALWRRVRAHPTESSPS